MEDEGSIWNNVPTLLAAAHELKSPLVLIRQLALEIAEMNDSMAVERIRLTAERSLQLVEGLTRAARLEDALFECEPIYLPSLYDEIAHELYPLATALSQTIRVATPRHKVTVVGHRDLLRSVLMGLCDNAMTHNPVHSEIILGARHTAQERVIASVRDFGPPTTQLRTMYRSVGRTPQALGARPRSSGLGLLIARQFARHMDAELTLQRHRDSGVTFSVSLPASQQLSLLPL